MSGGASPKFTRRKTADVDPVLLAEHMSNQSPIVPMMVKYDIPDFNYPQAKLESRPVKIQLLRFEQFLNVLDVLGQGQYFSQGAMEKAWDLAFKSKFLAGHKSFHWRKTHNRFSCRCSLYPVPQHPHHALPPSQGQGGRRSF